MNLSLEKIATFLGDFFIKSLNLLLNIFLEMDFFMLSVQLSSIPRLLCNSVCNKWWASSIKNVKNLVITSEVLIKLYNPLLLLCYY